MLKPKTTSVYSVITGLGTLLDIIILEESVEIEDYLKAKYPDMFESLQVKLIDATELVSAYKVHINRAEDEENQQIYVNVLKRSANVDVNFDTSTLFDDLDNMSNSEITLLTSDITSGLLKFNRNSFLQGMNTNLIWLTVLGILSDYAGYLQKDIKALQDKNISAEARKAVLFDIIAYFVVLKKIYTFVIQHGIYNSDFLDCVDGVRHHLEKIK